MQSAMEAKNNIQYKPLDLVAISDFFCEYIGLLWNNEKRNSAV
jgi:hypothetical protein